jgi:hypothetical protein
MVVTSTRSICVSFACAAQSGPQPSGSLKVLDRTSIIMNESVMREAAQGLGRVTSFQGENTL